MIDFDKRPLSWSCISSFRYNKEEWYNKYILGIPPPENAAMKFGKEVGEKLSTDPNYLPEVPRAQIYEYELKFKINGTPCVGYIDSYTPHDLLLEYKTAGKAWTQDRADEHGQLSLYALGLYTLHKVKPEQLTIKLVSMATEQRQDFTVGFVPDMKPEVFEVKLTMKDILMFGVEINKVIKEMESYVLNK